jgi:hypothetical protein
LSVGSASTENVHLIDLANGLAVKRRGGDFIEVHTTGKRLSTIVTSVKGNGLTTRKFYGGLDGANDVTDTGPSISTLTLIVVD